MFMENTAGSRKYTNTHIHTHCLCLPHTPLTGVSCEHCNMWILDVSFFKNNKLCKVLRKKKKGGDTVCVPPGLSPTVKGQRGSFRCQFMGYGGSCRQTLHRAGEGSHFCYTLRAALPALCTFSCHLIFTTFQALVVKNPPANAADEGDVGLIPGSGRFLEKEMTTHASILA